jgi:hypothetical protein
LVRLEIHSGESGGNPVLGFWALLKNMGVVSGLAKAFAEQTNAVLRKHGLAPLNEVDDEDEDDEDEDEN